MSFSDDTRIYNSVIDIDPEFVKSFWNNRLTNSNNLNAVLLGSQNNSEQSDLRNLHEKKLLDDIYLNNLNKKISVLDIGCGIGRWVKNLKDCIAVYHGIDFSNKCIEFNKKNFQCNENLNFFEMSATDIAYDKLLVGYDLIIINGILMYINDIDIDKVFNSIACFKAKNIYIQESISILNERLTLKEFYSSELGTNYSAIYRLQKDYESLIIKHLGNYSVIKKGVLLDRETGARDETNAYYWFLNGNASN